MKVAAVGAEAAFFDSPHVDGRLVRLPLGAGRRPRRLIPRRRLYADAWANLQFRLQGSTDEGDGPGRASGGAVIAPPRDRVRAPGPDGPRRRAAAPVPADAAGRLRAPGRGRPLFICTAATQGTAEMSGDRARLRRRARHGAREEDGVLTGRIQGPFNYGEGKPVRMRQLAGTHGIDLSASWAYATRPPTCRCCGLSATRSRSIGRRARPRRPGQGWEVMRSSRRWAAG